MGFWGDTLRVQVHKARKKTLKPALQFLLPKSPSTKLWSTWSLRDEEALWSFQGFVVAFRGRPSPTQPFHRMHMGGWESSLLQLEGHGKSEDTVFFVYTGDFQPSQQQVKNCFCTRKSGNIVCSCEYWSCTTSKLRGSHSWVLYNPPDITPSQGSPPKLAFI